MIHRFPCQDACASNRWINLLYFSCQLLQLLTLEAASRKRLSLFLSLRSTPLQSTAFEQTKLCHDPGSSPQKPDSLPIKPMLRVLTLCSMHAGSAENSPLGHSGDHSYPRETAEPFPHILWLTKARHPKFGMADRVGEIHSNAKRAKRDDQSTHCD